MQIIDVTKIEPTGLPLYEMRKIFTPEGDFSKVDISFITLLPGQRVPTTGLSCHDSDEYSYFISGEVYSESGAFHGVCGAGCATLIPKGETHWCENRTQEPCTLVCAMVKPKE